MNTRRTYSREDWLKAQEAWKDGDFSAEWKDARHWAATDATIIFPPDGTPFDSWADDSPSQRAMLIRAIRETPKLLRQSIRGARSWSEVIERLTGSRDLMREDGYEEERHTAYRRSHEPTREEAGAFLRDLLGRLKEPTA
jgi:hypothetical protein